MSHAVQSGRISFVMASASALCGLAVLIYVLLSRASFFTVFSALCAVTLSAGYIVFSLKRYNPVLLAAYSALQFFLTGTLFVFAGLNLQSVWLFGSAGPAIAFLLISMHAPEGSSLRSVRYLGFSWALIYLFLRLILSFSTTHSSSSGVNLVIFWSWTGIVCLASLFFIWQSVSAKKQNQAPSTLHSIVFLCFIVFSLILAPITTWLNNVPLSPVFLAFSFLITLSCAISLLMLHCAIADDPAAIQQLLEPFASTDNASVPLSANQSSSSLPRISANSGSAPNANSSSQARSAAPLPPPVLSPYISPSIAQVEQAEISSIQTSALPDPFQAPALDMDSLDTCALPSPFQEPATDINSVDTCALPSPFSQSSPTPPVAPAPPANRRPTPQPQTKTMPVLNLEPKVKPEDMQTFLLEAPSQDAIDEWKKNNNTKH